MGKIRLTKYNLSTDNVTANRVLSEFGTSYDSHSSIQILDIYKQGVLLKNVITIVNFNHFPIPNDPKFITIVLFIK